jgi:hypothetical protein
VAIGVDHSKEKLTVSEGKTVGEGREMWRRTIPAVHAV